MSQVHAVIGFTVVGLFVAASLLGGVAWWRPAWASLFWVTLRVGQLGLVVQAALGGVLLALGLRGPELHLLYGLLPLAVSFAAEQLRVSAAETVLAARGLPDAAAVGRLAEGDQRDVVEAIVRREIAVMAVSAAVVVALVVRAVGWV